MARKGVLFSEGVYIIVSDQIWSLIDVGRLDVHNKVTIEWIGKFSTFLTLVLKGIYY